MKQPINPKGEGEAREAYYRQMNEDRDAAYRADFKPQIDKLMRMIANKGRKERAGIREAIFRAMTWAQSR